jgi:outer membrane PBP1 activator LpoA protein
MLPQFRLLFLLLGILIINGCATDVSQPGRESDNAEQLFAQGEYEQAGRDFIELAKQSAKREKNQFLLRASAAAARSDNVHQARQILKSVEIEPTNALHVFLLLLSEAHIAVMERRAEDVLTILQQVPSVTMPYPYLADYYDLRADAQTMLGNRLETARDLVKREVYLKSDVLIAANQQDIWKSLGMLSERALQQLRTDPPPDILSGWMELVQITKAYQLHPASLKDAVTRWRHNYPGHPARAELLADLQSRKQEDFKPPKSIAVLLPLSGKYRSLLSRPKPNRTNR